MSEQTEALEVVKHDFLEVKKKAAALRIIDDATRNFAVESIALLKKLVTKAESLRKARVQPLIDEKAAIDARYKEFSEPASSLLTDLTHKLIGYNREQEAKAEAARREQQRLVEEAQRKQEAAERKAEKKGVPPPPPPPVRVVDVPVVQKTTASSFGAVSVQENWTWEVTSEKDVPREYLVVDNAKITRMVKAGVRQIAGIRIFDKGKVSLR